MNIATCGHICNGRRYRQHLRQRCSYSVCAFTLFGAPRPHQRAMPGAQECR
jgi:hypothetical protein